MLQIFQEKSVFQITSIECAQEVLQVSAGLRHVSAISNSGDLLLWGDSKHVKPVFGLNCWSTC